MAGPLLSYSDNNDEGGYAPLSEINVTPLVDVMLVLLIIFMVAAPMMMVGVPVQLPRTSAPTVQQSRPPLIVSMTQEGKIFVRSDEVAAEILPQRLAALNAEDATITVYIRADRGIPYGDVMRVMGRVTQAGFSRVSLIAESENSRATQAQ